MNRVLVVGSVCLVAGLCLGLRLGRRHGLRAEEGVSDGAAMQVGARPVLTSNLGAVRVSAWIPTRVRLTLDVAHGAGGDASADAPLAELPGLCIDVDGIVPDA